MSQVRFQDGKASVLQEKVVTLSTKGNRNYTNEETRWRKGYGRGRNEVCSRLGNDSGRDVRLETQRCPVGVGDKIRNHPCGRGDVPETTTPRSDRSTGPETPSVPHPVLLGSYYPTNRRDTEVLTWKSL